ncbi:MAG: hypothetical protein PHO26_10570, partial [Dehalococcoidia bacterium]|nr:hypothetical protein [Dehalococcoidia bacterium]MDD5495434.1 hypothetical protein [Dehalococcoidia bacterium]
MKTNYPSFLGVLAAIIMVASFVLPTFVAEPSAVSADPGIMKWDTVNTPNARPLANDIMNHHAAGANTGMGSELLDMAIGNDGLTLAWIIKAWSDRAVHGMIGAAVNIVYLGLADNYSQQFGWSNNSGISASTAKQLNFNRNSTFLLNPARKLFAVRIAPDDPKYIAVTSDNGSGVYNFAAGGPAWCGPKEIWVSVDSGQNWELAYSGTGLEPTSAANLAAGETIKAFDVSIDYGGKRDIAFGTVGGTNGGRWAVGTTSGFGSWVAQLNPNGVLALNPLTGILPTNSALSYQDIKFSPTYNGDSSICLLYSNVAIGGGEPFTNATYFNIALRDLATANNSTLSFVYGNQGIEVVNPNLGPVAGAGA